MDKVTFSTDAASSFGGPPITAVFNAWNPYLDASLLGPNYNVYAKMYNYFKYKGIKVKWIPNVKTANLLQPRMTGIKPTHVNYLYENKTVVPTQVVNASMPTVTEWQDGGVHAHYSNTGEENTGYQALANIVTHQTTGTSSIPTYENYTPSYEDNYGYAPSLKMHVLFSKDDFTNLKLPSDPLFLSGTQYQMLNTVYKYKPYVQNMKTQNYKIYDMSKPFKFYCRPYCSSNANETLGFDSTDDARSDATIITTTGTALYDGNRIIKKKRIVPRMVVYPESMINLVPSENTTIQQKWQARVSDANFFNPVLFGYFFTVDGIAVDDWIRSVIDLAGEPDFDKCVPKYAKFLSSYGHFEITTYASFNELNNTLVQ